MCVSAVLQAIAGGGESAMSKRDRRDLNHLLSLTCRKLRSKMPANLLFREAPEKAAQKAQDSFFDASSNTTVDRSAAAAAQMQSCSKQQQAATENGKVGVCL